MIESLIIGIVAGAMSIIIIQILNYSAKPKLVISKYLTQYKKDDMNAVCIKILNHTKFDLVDLSVQLFGITNLDTDGKMKKKELIKNFELKHIAKYEKNSKEYDYALQIPLFPEERHSKDLVKYIKESEFTNLLMFVMVKNPYYNSIVINKQSYIISDILDEGYFFESGDDISARKNP